MKTCHFLTVLSLCWFFQCCNFVATVEAQGLLDQFRNRVEGEILERLGGGKVQPGQPSPSPVQSQSVPWESGNQNNPGGNFRDSGGFLPPTSQPPAHTTYPSSNSPQPRQIYPGTTARIGNPSLQTYPQGSSTPGVTYQEVPIRKTATNGQPIKLKLSDSLRDPVKYQLILGTKSFDYEMRTGESQTFSETTQWLVRFRREGTEITYRLRGGNTYEFEMDTQGRISLFEARPDEFPEPPKR